MKLENIIVNCYSSSEIPELIKKAIPQSEKNFPGVDNVWFLDKDWLIKHAELAQIPADIIKGFLELRQNLVKYKEVLLLLWHFHQVLHECDYETDIVNSLPDLEKLYPELYPFLCLVLVLSGFPSMKELYKKKGYPDKVLLNTFKDVSLWTMQWNREYGIFGIKQETIAWEMSLLHCNVFRLGRLQFQPYEFNYDEHVFRNVKNGKVKAISGNDIRYNRQGLIDGVDDVWDESENWISVYSERNGKVFGNPISQDGYAHQEKIEFDLGEWQVILQKGNKAINVHIPADGPILLDDCMDSCRSALKFFSQYFPEYNFKCFCCFSWLLDPQFENLLKDTSNIIQFQRSGYLLPFSGTSDAIIRVFGKEALTKDINSVPCNSGMRKSFAAFLNNGGVFHNGMWLLFPQDLHSHPIKI